MCVENVGADYGWSSSVDVCEATTQPGDWDYCSSSSPCSAGKGDCDPGKGECAPGLVCVENIGASYGFGSGVDVCEGPDGGGDSCVGQCGGNAGDCWCDSACAGYGDCCGDYDQACGG